MGAVVAEIELCTNQVSLQVMRMLCVSNLANCIKDCTVYVRLLARFRVRMMVDTIQSLTAKLLVELGSFRVAAR